MQFITSNIFPISMALISAMMLLWSFFGNRIRGIQEVDCNGALQLLNHKGALVLDVRTEDEYKSGHILNSRLIPLSKLAGSLGEIEKHREQPIVVVCRSGNRSAAACVLLGKQGFQAYNLAGGMLAWQKAKLPMKK